MNRRWDELVNRYVANPPMRALLRLGLAPRAFALLETTGRRSGRPRVTPIGGRLEGTTYWLVAIRRDTSYVANLRADPACRVKVGRTWRAGTATLLPDDDRMARRTALDRANGWIGRLDGRLFRAAAHDPLTVRIDLAPAAGPE